MEDIFTTTCFHSEGVTQGTEVTLGLMKISNGVYVFANAIETAGGRQTFLNSELSKGFSIKYYPRDDNIMITTDGKVHLLTFTEHNECTRTILFFRECEIQITYNAYNDEKYPCATYNK